MQHRLAARSSYPASPMIHIDILHLQSHDAPTEGKELEVPVSKYESVRSPPGTGMQADIAVKDSERTPSRTETPRS